MQFQTHITQQQSIIHTIYISQHIIISIMTYANAQRPTQRLYAYGINPSIRIHQFPLELSGIIAPTHRAYDEFPVAPTSLYKAYDALDRYHLFV